MHLALPYLLLSAALCFGQTVSQTTTSDPQNTPAVVAELPDATDPQQSPSTEGSGASTTDSSTKQSDPKSQSQSAAPANAGAPSEKQQPKRILGIMPNFRAVSAGEIPPPPQMPQRGPRAGC